MRGFAYPRYAENDYTLPYSRPCMVIKGEPGKRHHMSALDARMVCATAQTAAIGLVIRDGTSGVGTILWAGVLVSSGSGDADAISARFDDVTNPVVGSVNTDMTIECITDLVVTGTNNYVGFAVVYTTSPDAPPAGLWRFSQVAATVDGTLAAVAGQRYAITAFSSYLRHAATGGTVAQGVSINDGTVAKQQVIWGWMQGVTAYVKESKDALFPVPIIGSVNRALTVHADTTQASGLQAVNVWGVMMT